MQSSDKHSFSSEEAKDLKQDYIKMETDKKCNNQMLSHPLQCEIKTEFNITRREIDLPDMKCLAVNLTNISTGEKINIAKIENKSEEVQSATRTAIIKKPAEKKITCQECNKTTSVKNFARHKKLHLSDKSLSCDVCKRTFILQYNLTRHHESCCKQSEALSCDECGRKYANKHSLKRHKLIHLKVKPYHCDICGKGFIRSTYLEDHKKNHSGKLEFTCEFCEKSFARNGLLKEHRKTHTREDYIYECDICGVKTNKASRLESHLLIHTGQRPFSCDICQKTFKRPTHVTSHKNNMHASLWTGVQDITNKGVPDGNLSSSSNNAMFGCAVCGKYFKCQGNLSVHVRIHTDDNEIRCNMCQRGFSSKRELVLHEKIHKGEDLYHCDVCFKLFAKEQHLMRHQWLHQNKSVCGICKKSYSTPGALKRHSIIHAEEKPYVCCKCGMGFCQKISLTRHEKKHEKNKKM